MGLAGPRVASVGRWPSVDGDGQVTCARRRPGTAAELPVDRDADGELVLMSLATNRFLRIDPDRRDRADSPGPSPTAATACAWCGAG